MSEPIASSLKAWPWPVVVNQQVAESLDLTPADLREELERLFDSYDIARCSVAFSEEYGCYVFEWDGDWNYGLVGNCDDLLDVLRRRGVAYVVDCSAKHEWEAEIEWWHPGMDDSRREQGSQDSGVVLTRSTFATMSDAAAVVIPFDDRRDAMLGRLVAEFFAGDPWGWKPETTR